MTTLAQSLFPRRSRWTPILSPGAVLLPFILAACGSETSSEAVIQRTADAMGGAQRILASTTLVLEGSGTTYRTGQNTSPEADLPVFEVHTYRRAVDLENRRWRVEQVRTGHFLTGNPVIEQPLVQTADRDVAFDVQANGNVVRLGTQVGRERLAEFYHHPLTLIRALLEDPGSTVVENLREEDGHHVLDVKVTDGPELVLRIDRATDLPAHIESMAYHTNYGDVLVATSFGNYVEVEGLRLPDTIGQTLHRYPNGDFTVTSQVNAPVEDLAAWSEIVSAPELGPPVIDVTTLELAPGIWFLGPGYNSVLIEFPSFGVLVEASQHDQRALAVIQRARELIPEKPLRYLINTHFHIDHSGGVRAAVAEGLVLVTHESHAAYFEEMVSRAHTLIPDHLQRNPGPLRMELVEGDGPHEITEGDRTLVIHRLRDDVHSDGMLMVWLPEERILVEGDAYTPGARASPFAPNLLRQIRALGLDVERIAPIHGQVVPLSELERTVDLVEAEGSPWGFPQGGGGR